ncbi:MAG TPA: outer membrane protein transport protein [Sphingobium sp.]
MVMTKSMKAGLLSAIATAGVMAPGAAHAGGFYLQEQAVRGAGRAFSGEVADQGAASLWWNPASIGGLEGGDAHIGFSAILPRGTARDQGTVIQRPSLVPQPFSSVGGDPLTHNPIENGYLPTGAIAYGLTPNIAVGVALTSPFSFATQYNPDSWSRYNADRSMLRTYDIQPSVAVKFGGLSIGGAANIEYSKAYLSNYLPNATAAQGDGYQALQGNGWNVGWSVGAQYQTGPLSLGVAYKSSIKHTLDGTITVQGLQGLLASGNRTADATATFRTPWQVTFGGRLAVTDRLTLNAQATRFGWSEFDAIYLQGVGVPALPENYRDTWAVSTGFDLAVTPKWTLRSGVQYDQTPTQDGSRDPRVPDGDRWNFAGGTSYKLNAKFTIDAAVNYIKVNGVPIDRPTLGLPTAPLASLQAPVLTNGRLIDASVLVLSLGGRVTF